MLTDLLAQIPRERTWLITALRDVQHAEGWLSPDALAALAAPASPTAEPDERVAPPSIRAADRPAARFALLRREAERRRTGRRLAVGVGSCGLAVGAGETYETLRDEVARRGLPFTVVA